MEAQMFGSISVRNDHRDDAQLVSRTVAEKRFGHFSELQALDDGEVRSILNAAYKAGVALGRKFTADDIIDNESLHTAGELFAQRYEGDFSWLRDMQHDLGKWGSLSPAKAAGVLNCLM